MTKVFKLKLIIFLSTFAYSILRYHFFKSVPWNDLFLYTLNKSICWSAMFYIFIGSGLKLFKGYFGRIGPKNPKYQTIKNGFFKSALIMITLHALISITITSPHYYLSFYLETGAMGLKGNLTFLFGILAFAFLWMPYINNLIDSKNNSIEDQKTIFQKTELLSLIMVLIHIFVMGSSEWFMITKWPGLLPPITLLSFIVGVANLLLILGLKK